MSLLKTFLAWLGVDDMPSKVKSGYKTCPDGSIVRANVKCPVPTATLGGLNLSSTSFRRAVATSGAITGSTIGSTITATGLPSGLTINSSARTWAWSGAGSGVASDSLILTETKIGALGTPKANSISYTIAAAAPTLGTLSMSLPSLVRGVVAAGAITGATVGSTITAANLPSGLTITGTTWAWDGTGTGAVTGSITLTETLTGATNTPLDTAISYAITTATSLVYDTRFGTATDSNGWITFGLKSGSKRIWVNSSGGNDANNGLTAATAKATYKAACTLYRSGFTAADQLMVAGTGGRTYSDDGTVHLGAGGFSVTYPNAQLSYDPADAANSAKYGKLVGDDMPIITLATASDPFWGADGANGLHYVACQGIEFRSNAQGQNTAISFIGDHSGICWQNNRFNGVQTGANCAAAGAAGSNTHNYSKNSFWGPWNTNGNAQGIYLENVDGFYIQDNVFGHCGWKVGVLRDDDTTVGGAWYLGHGNYLHAGQHTGRVDRNVYFDNAGDGFNARTGVIATQNVTIDDAIAGVMGNFSGSYLEAPLGIVVTVDDWVIMGGCDTNYTVDTGVGTSGTNTLNGSYIRNVAMFDNPKSGAVNNKYFTLRNDNIAQIDTYMLYDKVHGINYSPVAYGVSGADTSKVHPNWTNCKIEVAVPSGTGNSVSTLSTFPAYKTKLEVLQTLIPGISRRGQAFDAMLYTPHLPWAQAIHAIAMPAMGLTPQFPTASPPSLSGYTIPAIYPTDETPPVITLPVGTRLTSTTATVGCTTDEGNGKIWYVVSTQSGTPIQNGIKRGFDVSGTTTNVKASGSITVSSTGAKSVTVTGLPTGTPLYAHLFHEDAVGNRSAATLTSASFTP